MELKSKDFLKKKKKEKEKGKKKKRMLNEIQWKLKTPLFGIVLLKTNCLSIIKALLLRTVKYK